MAWHLRVARLARTGGLDQLRLSELADDLVDRMTLLLDPELLGFQYIQTGSLMVDQNFQRWLRGPG